MNDKHIEEIISALYDMIQDARSVPLSSEKCIIERDKALDMLDEIIAQLPAELKQSRAIVESRNELMMRWPVPRKQLHNLWLRSSRPVQSSRLSLQHLRLRKSKNKFLKNRSNCFGSFSMPVHIKLKGKGMGK